MTFRIFFTFSSQVSEGVACFWRESRFRMLDHRRIIVAEALETDDRFSDLKGCVDANPVLSDDVMRRTTAVQTVVLEDVTSSGGNGKRGFVVGNTHLYFRPNADHIRLIQVSNFFCKIHFGPIISQLTLFKLTISSSATLFFNCKDCFTLFEFDFFKFHRK